MNDKNIFDALRDIDPEWILDAAPQKRRSLAHTWAKWGTIAACFCLVVAAILGAVFWQRTEDDPNGGSSFHTHVFGEWKITKEASCSELGEETRLCACGEKETQPIALLPHFAGAWVIEKEPTIKLPTPEDPTQREPGLKCQFCDRCGAKLDEEIIPATGSLGLAYAINPDGKTFALAGIGNCTDDDIIVPENFCGYHVTSVMKAAFSGCDRFKSITLPDTVTVIEEAAFISCGLESITLPEGLLKIGERAFISCDSLKEITIPANVKIGKRAFEDCHDLKSVVISSGIKRIEASTFEGCWDLETVILPEGLESIGERAFYHCWVSLKHITIPSTVTSIGAEAFSSCSALSRIVLPAGLRTVETGLFRDCFQLVSVTIPSSVKKIGNCAFANCLQLSTVSGFTDVIGIGRYAFENCYSLESIVLPDGLVTIEDGAFFECNNLREINIPDSVRRIGEDAFMYCTRVKQWENGIAYIDNWAVDQDDVVSEVVFRDGTVGIADCLFLRSGSIDQVTIPNSVKYIGARAFSDSNSLSEIIFVGTHEEWAGVFKGENWDRYSPWYSLILAPKENEQS